MTITDAYEVFRVTTVALALVVVAVMAVRWRTFLRASRPSQAGRSVVLWFVAANCFGTSGALLRDIPAGPWTPTFTVGMVLTGWWLWLDWRDERRQRANLCTLLEVPAPRQPVEV